MGFRNTCVAFPVCRLLAPATIGRNRRRVDMMFPPRHRKKFPLLWGRGIGEMGSFRHKGGVRKNHLECGVWDGGIQI